MTERPDPVDGIVVVDKPAGCTSHDVVARVRKLAGTRRVGHAGTLDPMATGVLVVGVGRATRLLGHLATTDKAYDATLRLGVTTTTDDAEGAVLATADASGVTDEALAGAVAALRGEISQVPSTVSAIKVDGVRAYARARAGEEVALAARPVVVSAFDVVARRGPDLDARVVCSTGTYVRALARDVGAALGVGAHLTALRRTRVGPFDLTAARTVDELADRFGVMPLAEAVAASFPRRDVTAADAHAVLHGGRLPALGDVEGPVGVFGPDGAVLALMADREGSARPLVVFA